MRLQKFLAQAGVASRRSAEALIAKGAVKVNGVVVSTLGTSVDPNKDEVEVEGKRARPTTPAYRVLLKPRACLSTLAESGAGGDAARPTLARYVPDRALGWQVAAPLDFPAEGVLLLTTDGELFERMSRGGGGVPMTYHLKYQGMIGDEEVGRLLKGWRWQRRPIKPESVVALATTGKNTWLEVVVREARPRVIKASGELLRKTVLKISRTRLGPVSFEGLRMGESRDLTKGEVNALRRAAGLQGGEEPEATGRKAVRSPSRRDDEPAATTGRKAVRSPSRRDGKPAATMGRKAVRSPSRRDKESR